MLSVAKPSKSTGMGTTARCAAASGLPGRVVLWESVPPKRRATIDFLLNRWYYRNRMDRIIHRLRPGTCRGALSLGNRWVPCNLGGGGTGFCAAHRGKEPVLAENDAPSRNEILERDAYTCYYCGRTESEALTMHIDHVVPWSKGGETTSDNLVTACADCNLSKGNKPLTDELRVGLAQNAYRGVVQVVEVEYEPFVEGP